MPYAVLDDLTRFGIPPAALMKLSDVTKEGGLNAACDVADGYLNSAFVLPLLAWGVDITRAVVAIATYDLLSNKGYNPDGSDQNVRDRYLDTIRWLERVAAGQIRPAGVIDSTPDEFEGGSFSISKTPRGW